MTRQRAVENLYFRPKQGKHRIYVTSQSMQPAVLCIIFTITFQSGVNIMILMELIFKGKIILLKEGLCNLVKDHI